MALTTRDAGSLAAGWQYEFYTNEVLHTIVLKGTTGTRCVFICRHSAFRGVFCQPCEKCELIGGREVKTSGTRREKIRGGILQTDILAPLRMARQT